VGNEFPEAEYVKRTFTIREMDFPPEVAMTKRSLLRWFCLSFGLISEKESRSTIIDVLDAIFHYQISKNIAPTVPELLQHLRYNQKKVDEKLLRYHLKRLIDVGLIERKKGKHSFVNAPDSERGNIVKGFEHNIGIPVQESVKRVSKALEKLRDNYKK